VRLLRSRAFWICALLISLPAIWYFWVSEWLAEREWQAYVREARAHGVRWTLAELRPAPVPAEEDAALLPIFRTAKQGAPPPFQVPALSKARKRPERGPARIDWQETRKSLPDYSLADDPKEPNDLLAIDKAVHPLQALIDQLCQSKAVTGNWGDETWVVADDFNLPHASTAMFCLRLLDFRANLDLALNRPADARRTVEAQLRLSRVFSKMPTLIMHLVSLSGTSLAREIVWEGLDNGAWGDDTLRAFAKEFLARNAIADHLWSMETERAYSRELAERWIGNPDKIMPLLQFRKGAPSKVDEWVIRMRASRRSWWRNNQVWLERSQDELLSTLDGEAQAWRPVGRMYDPKNLSDRDREGKLGMAAETMSSTESFSQRSVWVHAYHQMAAIACGLELCRRATGSFPDTLEALVPTYLPRLPVDPATGRAFRYRVQADGNYLLYSVGFDREDEDGRTNLKVDRDHTDPDWLWWSPSLPPRRTDDSPQ
jgi:hypothetical protein